MTSYQSVFEKFLFNLSLFNVAGCKTGPRAKDWSQQVAQDGEETLRRNQQARPPSSPLGHDGRKQTVSRSPRYICFEV